MNPLKSIGGTILSGIALAALIVFFMPGTHLVLPGQSLKSLVITFHVLAGITWIGLLYYFNFVQVPALGEAMSDEGGPGGAGIAKYVAPRALWWFRWGALATWLSGATFLYMNDILHQAFMLGLGGETTNVYANTIGIGAWLGTIMLLNVWGLIWPNQKKILGMVEATADEVARGKTIALMASRANTLMSIPMVMSMVGTHHGWMM
jgi:uncharacterized membrane protein